jgi:pimeloyl-ACP methyl ester carboxylesterase
MKETSQILPVSRGPYRLHAEIVPGGGLPVVLMHGFPDNTHSYDRLVPCLAGRRAVVRFDFLGWGARTSRRAIRTRPPTRWATWRRDRRCR